MPEAQQTQKTEVAGSLDHFDALIVVPWPSPSHSRTYSACHFLRVEFLNCSLFNTSSKFLKSPNLQPPPHGPHPFHASVPVEETRGQGDKNRRPQGFPQIRSGWDLAADWPLENKLSSSRSKRCLNLPVNAFAPSAIENKRNQVQLKKTDMARSEGSERPPLDPGVPTLGEKPQSIKKSRKRRILIYIAIAALAMLILAIILVVVELVVIHHAKADVFIDWPSTRYIFVLYVLFEGYGLIIVVLRIVRLGITYRKSIRVNSIRLEIPHFQEIL
jgi:hypothetical protein